MTQTTLDSPDHYTVGWITALNIERGAAIALLTSNEKTRGRKTSVSLLFRPL